MSNVQLLDKTRKIGKLLQKHSGETVLGDICTVMQDATQSDVFLIGKKGRTLFSAQWEQGQNRRLLENETGSMVDSLLNERLLAILSTKENVNLTTLGFDLAHDRQYTAIVTPVETDGMRLGTLFLYRRGDAYEIEDIILCEYSATLIGLELVCTVREENAEESRKVSVVKSALGTLSYLEQKAISLIFGELEGEEGTLVASRIADRAGITRSVIVNALRKFESAGIIEARSSGMKGTYIRVRNEFAFDEIKSL